MREYAARELHRSFSHPAVPTIRRHVTAIHQTSSPCITGRNLSRTYICQRQQHPHRPRQRQRETHLATSSPTHLQHHHHQRQQRRWIQISTTPSSSSTSPSGVTIDVPDSLESLDPYMTSSTDSSPPPDARFEVLGQSTASLLSVTLSASQDLHTRRGTLVGLAGSSEHTISRLSPLSPITRAPLGIPFLYQRVTSASPINVLVAPRGISQTTFSVLHLDGRVDWMVAQRNGLVAWTGRTLRVKPVINTRMTLAHWGNSVLTGRGLVALVGKGQVFQLILKRGEQYVAHPSNVLGYTLTPTPPTPYRFKSAGSFRFQVPAVTTLLPDTDVLRTIRSSRVYKVVAQVLYTLRTWARRTIWADRLFLQFHGPGTILLQSRGSSIINSLSNRDVDEIADSPAGAVVGALSNTTTARTGTSPTTPITEKGSKSASAGTGAIIPGPAKPV